MPTDDTDLIVPIDRWEELLRIVAVLGYRPEDHVKAAALCAVVEDNLDQARAAAFRFDYATPEVTPGGVIIRRSTEGS